MKKEGGKEGENNWTIPLKMYVLVKEKDKKLKTIFILYNVIYLVNIQLFFFSIQPAFHFLQMLT